MRLSNAFFWMAGLVPMLGYSVVKASDTPYRRYSDPEPDWVRGIALYIAPTMILASIGSYLRKVERHRDQDERNRRARALRREQGQFVLYARPFDVAGTLPVEKAAVPNPLRLFKRELAGESPDLEEVLAEAFESSVPMIGIGHRGFGVGKVESYSEWQSEFRALATAAKAVVVLPLETPGVSWELDWLQDNEQLEKCIVLMPPNLEAPSRWNEAVAGYSERLGIALPEYNLGGGLFLICRPGTRLLTSLGSSIDLDDLRQAIQVGLDEIESRGVPLPTVDLRARDEASRGSHVRGADTCASCGTYVIPTGSGECPACRVTFNSRGSATPPPGSSSTPSPGPAGSHRATAPDTTPGSGGSSPCRRP